MVDNVKEKELYAKLGMMFRALYLQIEAMWQLDPESTSACMDELSEAAENVARKHLAEIIQAKRMKGGSK